MLSIQHFLCRHQTLPQSTGTIMQSLAFTIFMMSKRILSWLKMSNGHRHMGTYSKLQYPFGHTPGRVRNTDRNQSKHPSEWNVLIQTDSHLLVGCPCILWSALETNPSWARCSLLTAVKSAVTTASVAAGRHTVPVLECAWLGLEGAAQARKSQALFWKGRVQISVQVPLLQLLTFRLLTSC